MRMQAFGQHVDEKATDELEGLKRHPLVSIAALDAVVLPVEGDAALIEGDQAAIGDSDAVGVARQIGDYCLGSAEWPLGMLLSWVKVANPSSQDRTPRCAYPLGRAANCRALPHERFSPLA
jgi:hypothetical protein